MTAAPPKTNGLIITWAARYDILAWLFTHGREGNLRNRIVELARLAPRDAVLDIGCGTGTLAITAARHVEPGGQVFGIDASAPMIARATWKAARKRADVTFQLAAAEQLPFADRRFDVVLSTLMLHHLPRPTRQRAVAEACRVLKPGGRMLAVDFGRPTRKGLVARFHRHGHVPIEQLVALIEGSGLKAVARGPVAMNDLQFVLAEVPR
jgi:ubiquinone/menaquinone biosynthesis C-methylase UbiE